MVSTIAGAGTTSIVQYTAIPKQVKNPNTPHTRLLLTPEWDLNIFAIKLFIVHKWIKVALLMDSIE